MTKEEVFSFPSADGRTTVHAVRWTPEDGKYRAVLQITHGMVEYIERYRAFAEFLNDNGFLVVGHDHIGHGESVVSKNGDILQNIPAIRWLPICIHSGR